MKITKSDGTVLEGEIDELLMYEQALAAKPAPEPVIEPDPFAYIIEEPMLTTCEDIVPKTHVDIPLVCRPEEPAHIPLHRLPGEPRRGVNRYIPVTESQEIALRIMRTDKARVWTSREVVNACPSTDIDVRRRVAAAVGKMARDRRGVVRVENNNHYMLDEWGMHAIPVLYLKPTFKWEAMKLAWQQGRAWIDVREQETDDVADTA